MEKQVIDDKIKELFISSRVIALVGASNDKEYFNSCFYYCWNVCNL